MFCVCVCVPVFLQRRGVEEGDIKKLISAALYDGHWAGSCSSGYRTKKLGDL